ncbi:hypothetical protein EON65_06900 [archaeon]|nr:MAG: hypothetical protein EON65_06900 [archaeon]
MHGVPCAFGGHEGAGIKEDLVTLLGQFVEQHSIPIIYADGMRCMEDVALVRQLGRDRVDCIVGWTMLEKI